MSIEFLPGPGSHDREAVLKAILLERERQIEEEGFVASHDNHHADGDLARAAACYAMPENWREFTPGSYDLPLAWPWGDNWWKPGERRRELIKAAALIVAELERMARTEVKAKPT